MGFPSLFVEIGSDDRWYRDESTGRVAAAAVLHALGAAPLQIPVRIAVGGGHYMPRATDLGRGAECDFGHLLPSHALEEAGAPLLAQAMQMTPGCEGVHIHKKGLSGPLRRQALAWCDQLGLAVSNRD